MGSADSSSFLVVAASSRGADRRGPEPPAHAGSGRGYPALPRVLRPLARARDRHRARDHRGPACPGPGAAWETPWCSIPRRSPWSRASGPGAGVAGASTRAAGALQNTVTKPLQHAAGSRTKARSTVGQPPRAPSCRQSNSTARQNEQHLSCGQTRSIPPKKLDISPGKRSENHGESNSNVRDQSPLQKKLKTPFIRR